MKDEKPIWTEEVDDHSFVVFALGKDEIISMVGQQTGNELLKITCTSQDEKPAVVVIRKISDTGEVGVVSFCFPLQPGNSEPIWVELRDLQEADWSDDTKKEVTRLMGTLDRKDSSDKIHSD